MKLLLGTRKGLIVYQRQDDIWSHENTHFVGIPVSIAYRDPRNNTWWACQDHGHWGVKLHRSPDEGKTWEEVPAPAFPEGEEIKDGVPASTKYLWAMQHGGKDHPERLWIGTEPGGLFVSEDGGDSFKLVRSLWDHPSRKEQWFGGGRDYPGIHSIIVDPNDSDHLYVGISCAGVFESHDAGYTWTVKNDGLKADFLPDPNAKVGHDPHLLVACPNHPEFMWQQNHCGIFMSRDGANTWKEVSQDDGPANFGFAISVDANDPERAWVVPAVSDVTRVAIDRALCVCRTDDGGKSWQVFRKGLPQNACYDIVYRHALAVKDEFVVFGSTTGNLFTSWDQGESWQTINHHLPMIYSIQIIE